MLIDQLPTLASPIGTDEFPIERGTTTYKTTLNNLLNWIKTGGLVYKAGDTVSFSGARVMGRLFNAGDNAYVVLQLPKQIIANNVSVTLTSANVFCVSGSTNASSLTVSNVGMNKDIGQVTFSFPIANTFTGGTVCMAEIAGSATFS